ncbi:MAG TPA: efflux RND transporter permease subunit [Candidatus Bathyarchaeia archaeon]|nr:efflux RND transporter permease subunit [Candidatus Bathyarchaeia archaeon]
MLFTRLARTIIKHNRAVFVIWLVALALSVPAILQVQSVIVYTETAYNPKNSESSLAQSIVSKEFSISQGSSVVVVITSKDVRGNDVRDFTLTLNKTLHNDRTITNISNITSIYDIYYQLLVGYNSVVHLQLYQEKNLTSLATSLEFGIPSTYVSQWTTLVNSGPFNVSQTQVAVYNQKANQSAWLSISSQTPQAYLPIALAYENIFYQSWNQTFTAATYTQTQLTIVAPPLARAQNVTRGSPLLATQPAYYNITIPFFQSSIMDATTRALFIESARFFNLYNFCPNTCPNNYWTDPVAIQTFVIDSFSKAFNATPTQKFIISEIYLLGPSASFGDLTGLAGTLLRNYNVNTYPVQPSRDVYTQFVSGSNDTMLVILDFRTTGPDPKNSIASIRTDVQHANVFSNTNLLVYVTGAPAFNFDIENESIRDVERIDPITIILILVIVGIFFASLAAPLIPVSAIGISVGIAFGLVYVIGTFFTSVHFLILTLLPVAMFGAGSDYCIFLVSRYAEERRMGRGKKDSVERAVTWAGESIATSGATVVIAFGSLAIAGFGMLRSIGIAVMMGISIALLVALTLVPAILSMFGDRMFWPGGLGLWRKKKSKGNSYYARAARFTAKHSKLILIVALAVSLPATSTVLSSQTSHDLISQVPISLESRAGYNSMVQGFGPGTITPTYTIVQTPVLLATDNWINITALRSLSYAENSTLSVPGVSKVYGLTHPSGDPIPYSSFMQLNAAQQQTMIRSMKPFLGSDGKSAMVWANLSNEPYTDQAISTLAKIRQNVNGLRSNDKLLAASSMLVGGETASVADLANSSAADYFNMTALVLVGVFVVLMIALGSIFTPLRLIFTILLSISWAMAAVIYVFHAYFGMELIWILPIMLLVIMLGLGLDYDIFLVTRIREYVVGGAKDDEAIESAVEHTGSIITATGLVTAGAFGTMMISQIPMLQQLGLAFFIVVLLDATLTRVYLVPSIMRHMKRLNWWAPGRIRRVPITPEEKLIPPIPMKTKLTVTMETIAIVGLGLTLYLDYINNQYLQGFVKQTNSKILAGINVWTGVILGVTSFLTTYILLRGKPETHGAGKLAIFRNAGKQLTKLRPRRAKIPMVAVVSSPSISAPPLGATSSTETILKPSLENKKQTATPPPLSSGEKKSEP